MRLLDTVDYGNARGQSNSNDYDDNTDKNDECNFMESTTDNVFWTFALRLPATRSSSRPWLDAATELCSDQRLPRRLANRHHAPSANVKQIRHADIANVVNWFRARPLSSRLSRAVSRLLRSKHLPAPAIAPQIFRSSSSHILQVCHC
jgi:hypothetical protein